MPGRSCRPYWGDESPSSPCPAHGATNPKPIPPPSHSTGTRQPLGQGDRNCRMDTTAIPLLSPHCPLTTGCLAALTLNSLIPGEIFSVQKGRAKLGIWEGGRHLSHSGTMVQENAFGEVRKNSRKDPGFGTQLPKHPLGRHWLSLGLLISPSSWDQAPIGPGTLWAGYDPVCCKPVHPS